ncbi:TetR/AcrR family transcriptional regulator [Arthrobacter sp. W4I7]|uniref:TetR/AcrR family transcriptional regulator n=1 Tax=Arthrobacter sp. W4I7 TaxID=3042296 RepID=UPI0027D8B3BE|nr:TetR/AcrR family transcriptional regulator [Arthrobacter sp. W4I7]
MDLMDSNSSQPVDPDSASRKDRILDVAIDEFSSKGFAATRVDTIARRANANKQLIYYYFTSKSGLYEAVLSRLVEAYKPGWKAMEGGTVEQMIQLRARNDVSMRPWQRLLAWEGTEYWADENRTIHMEDVRARAYRAQTDIIANAQRAGNFPPDIEPEYASLILLYAYLGPIVLPQITKMVTGLDPDDPGIRLGITRALEAYLHGYVQNPASSTDEPSSRS